MSTNIMASGILEALPSTTKYFFHSSNMYSYNSETICHSLGHNFNHMICRECEEVRTAW